MKLRVTLALPTGDTHDITLECDVTTTVADTARALIRAGTSGDPHVEKTVRRRLAPVTLLARPSAQARPVLLDPASPIGSSGLLSGWTIEPVAEFGPHSDHRRLTAVAGYIEVLTGRHAGVHYSLIAGSNLIGRDRNSRIYLSDHSVSRRHASLDIGDEIQLRDLGSINGTLIDGGAVHSIEKRITKTCDLVLGDVTVRIFPGPPVAPPEALTHQTMHMRSPRIAPRFPATQRDLPAPPSPVTQSRIPILAMLAPMMMGGAMYMITQSPMSLMMVAFSPLMMVGSWVDGKLGGKRKLKREFARFEAAITAERDELRELHTQEVRMRAAETPTLCEVTRAIAKRDSMLWARRPEHRAFLEVRFGTGKLSSRTELTLPNRGEAEQDLWEALRLIESDFRDVTPVPVLERFDRCGSIGVAGTRNLAGSMARSLVLQLIGLHSPGDMALTCFAHPDDEAEWAWLKWLPHISCTASPLTPWHLASNEPSSIRLLVSLEQLLEARRHTAAVGKPVRSHQTAGTRNDDEQGEAVQGLPVTPAVIVLVLSDNFVDTSRLIALAEEGPDLGIHIIWVAAESTSLPAACRTFVELYEDKGRVNFVRSGVTVPLRHREHVSAAEALALARSLAPVEDTGTRLLDESDLPKTVNLREFHHTDVLGGPEAILRSWARSGSLTVQRQENAEQDPLSLNAIIGQGPDGPVSIDLRAHGPHALVGGTTGAGKSEFLQTWIMSLAMKLSPKRLNFLLIDYKGGAAFAECTELPHTVGLVTDLTPHLVRRALTSLRAELHHREELLARHGAKDLITMERRSDPAAPPVLLIVIDEFAALAADVPEFVDGVVDIAQRGRSLGLHLIMATQRPSGVIKDNLRANTNLRVALRMADESDSRDVIDVKDAAFFDTETPGRGAIKIGPGRISHFQTGYLGGRAAEAPSDARLELRTLNFTEGEPWDIPPEISRDARSGGTKPRRDIEQLRDSIVAAALAAGLPTPRRPWQNELSDVIDLQQLDRGASAQVEGENTLAQSAEPYLIGLRDVPAEQAQRPIHIDFDEVGNLAFIGAGGTGKTTALITLAAVLSGCADTAPVHIYGVDAAGGTLDAISVLPTVGRVAPFSDTELTGRVLQHLLDVIEERGPRYSAARTGNFVDYRRTIAGRAEPRLVLLLDGFAAFRQANETISGLSSPLHILGQIMLTGRVVGVHVVLTADRPTVIPASIASSLQQQYVLRLASVHDYAYLGVNGDGLEESTPGRAVLAGSTNEIQLALLGGNRDLAAQVATLEELAALLRTQKVQPATEVRNAPEQVRLHELRLGSGDAPAFGMDTRTFASVTMPTSGLAVISGPAGSGQSTAALSLVEAFETWAGTSGDTVETVLLTFQRDGLRDARTWDRVAYGADDVRCLAEELVPALGGKLPSEGRTPLRRIGGSDGPAIWPAAESAMGMNIGPLESSLATESAAPSDPLAPPVQFPSHGTRGVIVVERPTEAEGTESLAILVALAKVARRADALVIFEFEQGEVGGTWDLFSALKQPRWGIMLQPDDGGSQTPFRESFGRVKRADFPPGRGFVVENGRLTPVHVALPQVFVHR